jgi:hypothetical protein
MTDPSVRDALQELIESARLLGATQAKKGFGCYTPDDARFEHAMYESIAKHKAALSKQEAATPASGDPDWETLCKAYQKTYASICVELVKAGETAFGSPIEAIKRLALKAAQPVPLNVAAQEQRSGLSDARHDSPQANETPPPVAATPAPQEPAEPVAWLLRPIKPRHKPFVRGIYSTKPTAEQYEMAALDGDEYIPLYYTQSVADAQDAGRYRWLKDKSGFDIRSLLDVGDFTSLNAHIDAAMALDVTKRDPNEPKGKE